MKIKIIEDKRKRNCSKSWTRKARIQANRIMFGNIRLHCPKPANSYFMGFLLYLAIKKLVMHFLHVSSAAVKQSSSS